MNTVHEYSKNYRVTVFPVNLLRHAVSVPNDRFSMASVIFCY